MIKETIIEICDEINKRTDIVKKYNDLGREIQISFFISRVLESIPEVAKLKEILASDPLFKNAPLKAGHHGQLEQIIYNIFVESVDKSIESEEIKSDYERAFNKLDIIRKILSANDIIHEGSARITGLTLEEKEIIINDEVKIVELGDDEVKLKKTIENIAFYSPIKKSLSERNKTEIQLRIKTYVNETESVCILNTVNVANARACKICRDIISALYIMLQGNIDLGPIDMKFPFGGTISSSSNRLLRADCESVKLQKKDIENFKDIFNKLHNPMEKDELLERVLRRIYIGKTRENIEDRLIDYVIAWESILLTVNSNQNSQELSYRFRLNGSTIINKCLPDVSRKYIFDFMDCVYKIRSVIVHGLSQKDIDKRIRESGCENLLVLINEMELYLQKVIIWLINLPLSDRPYYKKDEWEILLWN